MNEQLQADIQAIEDELSQLTPHTAQWAEAKRKLEDLKKQAASAEAVTAAQESIVSEFDNITVGEGEEQITFALRDICISEAHYEFLSAWLTDREGTKAEELIALENSYKSEIEAQEETIAELEKAKAEANRLSDLLADMTAKRDAAGAELLNANEEVARLTADNESLRKQLESKPATKSDVNLRELAKKIEAAKPGIYSKRWKINDKGLEDRRYYTANLSETGEEIDIPLLEIGKYREETPEQAETFRQQKAAEEAAKLAQEAAESVAVPDLTFQQEEEPAVQTDSTNGEVDNAPVSREEFEELKARVGAIEANSKGVAA